jgi:hypothetical protein
MAVPRGPTLTRVDCNKTPEIRAPPSPRDSASRVTGQQKPRIYICIPLMHAAIDFSLEHWGLGCYVRRPRSWTRRWTHRTTPGGVEEICRMATNLPPFARQLRVRFGLGCSLWSAYPALQVSLYLNFILMRGCDPVCPQVPGRRFPAPEGVASTSTQQTRPLERKGSGKRAFQREKEEWLKLLLPSLNLKAGDVASSQG